MPTNQLLFKPNLLEDMAWDNPCVPLVEDAVRARAIDVMIDGEEITFMYTDDKHIYKKEDDKYFEITSEHPYYYTVLKMIG